MAVDSARRAAAVQAAKEIFWKRGYADASMAEMVEATGLNRYALYSEFGGKRELFLAALDDYFEECGRCYMPVMMNPEIAPFDRIRSVMNLMIDDMAASGRGCLMSQIAVEVAREDETIGAAVHEYFRRILAFLGAPLTEAAEAGRLNPNLTPEAAAQLVFDAKLSIGVHARAGADRARLERIVDVTMAALGAPQADT